MVKQALGDPRGAHSHNPKFQRLPLHDPRQGILFVVVLTDRGGATYVRADVFGLGNHGT